MAYDFYKYNQTAAGMLVTPPHRFAPVYGDDYSDVSVYWEEIFEDSTDMVEAIFSHDDVEAETRDLRPTWAKTVALIGLRVTDTNGQPTFYNRAETTDILGADNIREIEADHQALIDNRPA